MTKNEGVPVQVELEEILNQGLQKGFWDIVSNEELGKTKNDTIFLPYNYASKRDEASTTKSRLVHDLAASIPGKPSLNEAMLCLPDSENKLIEVLIRLRLIPILGLFDNSKFYEDRSKFR